MTRHIRCSGRNGDDHDSSVTWSPLGLRVGWYRRLTVQKWSPLMHEYELSHGIIVGGCRIGIVRKARRWLDGKEPTAERIAA